MKRKSFLLSVLALILIACAVIHPAVAYFTDNADANGAIPLYFVYKTEIWDDVNDLVKTVRILNIEHPDPTDPTITSPDIWVRARAYIGSAFTLSESPVNSGDSVKTGEWWYYQYLLHAGKYTTGLNFAIIDIPEFIDHEYADFNVAVVYESTLVYYDASGNPLPPDWTKVLDTSGTP